MYIAQRHTGPLFSRVIREEFTFVTERLPPHAEGTYNVVLAELINLT